MLIDYSKLQNEIELAKAAKHEIKCARFINELVDEELSFQLGVIKMGEVIHIANDSRWSLHELIVHCVKQTGPVTLHFCTYAIKEFQSRIISNMLCDGVLTEVHALVDYRFAKHDPQAEQLLASCSTTHRWVNRLHGKVAVLRNDDWAIAIVGSANLTTNTSRDTIVITCDKAISDYWINWITNHINNEIKSETKS